MLSLCQTTSNMTFSLLITGLLVSIGPLAQSAECQEMYCRLSSANDQPLFLTPLIESNQIESARQQSQTGKFKNVPRILSYSGYLTVNKEYDSNLFFWFFPAQDSNPNAQTILWLQGGPGQSSLFGVFVEHGPYVLDKKLNLSLREYTWIKEFNVIYVDSPVGNSFSFTKDDKGYAETQTQVASDLYEFLNQFFTVFYEYRKTDFYVIGESYAGKYVPSIAHKIYSEGSKSNINMKGIGIGNGVCDPITNTDYSELLFQLRLANQKEVPILKQKADEIVDKINADDYYNAFLLMDKLILDSNATNKSYFNNITGLKWCCDFTLDDFPEDYSYYEGFIETSEFRRATHVGDLAYHPELGTKVLQHLILDVMRSVKPIMPGLFNNYKVMFYSGQLDVGIPDVFTTKFLNTVEWKRSEDYKTADKQIWKVSPADKTVAGYVLQLGEFYQILIRNAGHFVPRDQPRAFVDAVTRFIKGQPF